MTKSLLYNNIVFYSKKMYVDKASYIIDQQHKNNKNYISIFIHEKNAIHLTCKNEIFIFYNRNFICKKNSRKKYMNIFKNVFLYVFEDFGISQNV